MDRGVIAIYNEVLKALKESKYFCLSYDAAFDVYGSHFFVNRIEFDECLKYLESQGHIQITRNGDLDGNAIYTIDIIR